MYKNAGGLFFAALATLFFIPFLGGVHLFDWDEINFAEIAREMIVLDNYLEAHINYEVFTEKPPFFFWLQAFCMNIFGVGEFAARLPNAIMGILVLPIIFSIGKKIHNRKFGYFWALAYFGSILPHLYFKSGIIDPVFNFFIFMGLYFLIRMQWIHNGTTGKPRGGEVWKYLVLAGLFTGLAVLTKGPAALVIICLTLGVYWIFNRFRLFISIPQFIGFILVTLSITALWFGVNFIKNGPDFIVEFTMRQWALFSTPDAGHGGFPGYHFVVLLFGCFPASIFMIQGMIKRGRSSQSQKDFRVWMKILFWVVLILFTIVKSKIVHYSSMAYFPLTYFAAYSIYYISEGTFKMKIWMKAILGFIGLLVASVTIVLPFAGMNIENLKPLFKNDPFAVENLQAVINWTGFEAVSGVFLLIIVIWALKSLKGRNFVKGIDRLFYGTAIWVLLTLVMYISKIETISQRAAIQFWEKQQGKDVYVATYDYKSYADLFYSKIEPKANTDYTDKQWLFFGEIDKPVYISCKVTHKEKLENEINDVQYIGHQNGFYFYVRIP